MEEQEEELEELQEVVKAADEMGWVVKNCNRKVIKMVKKCKKW